jgi:hypothetical protein
VVLDDGVQTLGRSSQNSFAVEQQGSECHSAMVAMMTVVDLLRRLRLIGHKRPSEDSGVQHNIGEGLHWVEAPGVVVEPSSQLS